MSVITISAIKADIGGYVGHSTAHRDLMAEAQRRVAGAIEQEVLIDAAANSCGDDVNLVMTHRHGADAEPVHHFEWDTFVALTEVTKRLHVRGSGQDLLAVAFSGNVRGSGPGVAEIEIYERPAEPFIAFAAHRTSPGAGTCRCTRSLPTRSTPPS